MRKARIIISSLFAVLTFVGAAHAQSEPGLQRSEGVAIFKGDTIPGKCNPGDVYIQTTGVKFCNAAGTGLSTIYTSDTPPPSGAGGVVPYSGITGLNANQPLYGGAAGAPSQSPNWLFVDPLMTLNNPSLGSTPTDSILLSNSTAAAVGAQQFSPAINQLGYGWVLLTAPSAPTSSAPTSGGSCTAGTHVWAYTFVNAAGETTIGSNSSAQTCGANATVPLTVIAAGPTGTTARKVYQSLAGTTTPLYLLTTLADNTTTTYSAVTADGSLGAVSPASNTTGNSQSVSFHSFVTPVQGTTANGSYWGLYSSIAGGAYSNLISVLPNGNVGIGTTSPVGRLAIQGSTADGSTFVEQWFNSSGTSLGGIKTNGNVGIGTTAPGSLLDLYNTNSVIPTLNLTAPNVANAPWLRFTTGGVDVVDISNSAGFKFVSNFLNNSNQFITNGGNFIVLNNTTELMRVDKNGNVGIGTTSPPAQLSLGGNISQAAWTTNGIGLANVPRTLTDTTSSGTVAAAYTDVLGGNTVAASSATTYTNYYSMYVNAPVAGTNVTMTNKYALGVDSLKVAASTFVLGGHTCSIVSTVLTCP